MPSSLISPILVGAIPILSSTLPPGPFSCPTPRSLHRTRFVLSARLPPRSFRTRIPFFHFGTALPSCQCTSCLVACLPPAHRPWIPRWSRRERVLEGGSCKRPGRVSTKKEGRVVQGTGSGCVGWAEESALSVRRETWGQARRGRGRGGLPVSAGDGEEVVKGSGRKPGGRRRTKGTYDGRPMQSGRSNCARRSERAAKLEKGGGGGRSGLRAVLHRLATRFFSRSPPSAASAPPPPPLPSCPSRSLPTGRTPPLRPLRRESAATCEAEVEGAAAVAKEPSSAMP